MTRPELWCAPGVYLAKVDRDIVMLALDQDRYHCLIDAAAMFDVERDRRVTADDESVLQALCDAGVCVRDRPPSPSPALIPPRRELALPPRPSLPRTLLAGLSMSASALAFRRKSLKGLVEAPVPARRTASIDERRLAFLVAAARAARPWIPFEKECLLRSFQLRRFLAEQGILTDWIFGVRTWPFAAHCWLQIDDLVVGDRLARTGRYTPILRA